MTSNRMTNNNCMQDRTVSAKRAATGSSVRALSAWLGEAAITAVSVALLIFAPTVLAQQGSHEGPFGVHSGRTNFGSLCGVGDTDAQRAMHLARSKDGKWSVIASNQKPGAGNDMGARIWHEKNWMVDLNDTPPQTSPVIHTGQMCFDPQGRLTLMIDRYTELAECRCMRFTSLTFAADGTVKEQEEKFVDEMSGREMPKPDSAKGFPSVWQYRHLDQLPFYSLLKK